jgi:Fe(3+) dicitrate transport protein
MLRKSLKYSLLVFLLFIVTSSYSQTIDSLKRIDLKEIEIKSYQIKSDRQRLKIVQDNVIYAGKKTELIDMALVSADLSTNNTRQIFSKVPGISIWENDGSGIQTSVASRGLSPNRSWEFNVRQNGYDISADPLGYPEAYYTPPMEALSKIEVVRGSSSLQFGPQFGGLLNYQFKKGDTIKPITYETEQTIGSYGMFNSYNAIGGTKNKFSYYGFLHVRRADGWRENSRYNTMTGYLSLQYKLSTKIVLSAEYTNMNFKSQQSGGLTDSMFAVNPRQSVRARNWFSTPWNLLSVSMDYSINSNINLNVKTFAVLAERNSVGYTKSINIQDSINPSTLQYNPRQVDCDSYENYGAEARLLLNYKLGKAKQILATGVRYFRGETDRNQLGVGTTGNDFDLQIEDDKYGRTFNYTTINYAVFAENIFQINNILRIIPGARFENIKNTVGGFLNVNSGLKVNDDERLRAIFLYGIGGEFDCSKYTQLYANYSRAYRPITFSELTPSATTDIIDPNLKDATGYNADFGYRGQIKNCFSFDVGVFYLNYNNRIGVIQKDGSNFKTNIGTSVSQGIESYLELDVIKLFNDQPRLGSVSLYSSFSYTDARYTKWDNPSIVDDPQKSYVGKMVENVPRNIHRLGCSYHHETVSASLQMSKVSSVFTDALNTIAPNATSTIGMLNGYQIFDFSLSYKIKETYTFKFGVNNIADEQYATRRSGGYPGPGILPGNGRTFYFGIGGKF